MSVDVWQDGSVTIVQMNRPDRRNAVDIDHAEALSSAFRSFDTDDSQSVAILTGAAGNFCAGADLHAIAEGRPNRVAEDGDGPMGPTRMRLGKPVIAAIEGYAVAGGLELALWCDLRVAAKDATLGVFCRRVGVPLIDGGTVRLPRLIGRARALDLILTGRAVSADEALHIGLVSRVCPPGEALSSALSLARQLAALPQTCLRHDRLSVLEQEDLHFGTAMVNEIRHGWQALADEAVRGATAFSGGAGRHGAAIDATPAPGSGDTDDTRSTPARRLE